MSVESSVYVTTLLRLRSLNCSERILIVDGNVATWELPHWLSRGWRLSETQAATFLSFTHHRFSLFSLRTIMSAEPSTSALPSNFVPIFNAALESYKRKTKKDLASHPLLPTLQSCDSPEAILTVLREQIPVLNQSQNGDDGLTKWVTPTINVLYAFSDMLGQGIGLVSITTFSRE